MHKAWLSPLQRLIVISSAALIALSVLALSTWHAGQMDFSAPTIVRYLLLAAALAPCIARLCLSDSELALEIWDRWPHPNTRSGRCEEERLFRFSQQDAVTPSFSTATGAHRAIADGAPVRADLNFPEDGLRQFFLILPEYCFLVSPHGVIIDSNPAACEALQYRKEELAGRQFASLSSPESAQRMIEAFERWKAEGELRSEEVTILTKCGEKRTALLNIGSIKRSDGKVLLAMSVLVDITERKRTEEAVKESEERFRLAIDTAPMMVWMSGPDRLCTYFNKSWLDFTGRPIEAELGNGWAVGVHPEDLQQCVETYEQFFDHRKEFRMEYRLRRHDGEYRWIIDIGVPRFSPQGTFAGYIGSCVDVTDRKRAEDERVRMLEAVAHLNRVASMGQLAASLAHELAQPLAAILANAQAAARFASLPQPDLEEVREALAEITEDDRRARAFLFNMRAMFQKQKISRTLLDLNEIIVDVARIFRNDAVRRGVQVRINPSPTAVLVSGDPLVVQQIVLNLVNNGMDALQSVPLGRKHLTLTTDIGRDKAIGTILVEDSGPGISAELKPKLFAPFVTAKQDGMGMGLSICRSLIESLGGRITLIERSEPGAAFQVELPVVSRQSVNDASDPQFMCGSISDQQFDRDF